MSSKNGLESSKNGLAKTIPGLRIIPNFITPEEEISLTESVDQGKWETSLRRRVQQYGWKYDYKNKTIVENDYLGPLPDWVQPIVKRFPSFDVNFNAEQMIVNEYTPGQGIAAHTDSSIFGSTIVSLSLGSTVCMSFSPIGRREKSKESIELVLPQRSILVMEGTARYRYTHEIKARKFDQIDGMKRHRKRRISLNFRSLASQNK